MASRFHALLLLFWILPQQTLSQDKHAPACDADRCLVGNCLMLVENEGNWKGNVLYPCEFPYEGRAVAVATGEDADKGYEEYTCCMPGYDSMSVDLLERCSTEACSSPDGKGGHDCSADGFVHPLVCDQDSEYKYAHKETQGNIYSPYICCTTQANQSSRSMVVAAGIWTALSGITFLACMVLILGILRSAKARAQGYNLYLVFLAVPDATFNLFSFCRNIVNLSGNQLSNPMGGTVHALEWFHTAANMWLNAFIVYQIHTMLLKAQRFERTAPPTVRQVLCQVAVFYFFAGLWAAWSLVLLLQGSNIFENTDAAWLTSKALMCCPPFLYTLGACLHVWWKKLLPSKGRTRILSLYFLRVVLVFLLTWVPFLILVDVTYYKTASLWMLGLAYYFASLQGLLSAVVAMGKPDIKRAVINLICCRPDEFNETEAGFLGSQAQRLGKSIMSARRFSSRLSFTRSSLGATSIVSKEFECNSTFRDSIHAPCELREDEGEDVEAAEEWCASETAAVSKSVTLQQPEN
jgi:hypothetical protein